MPNEITQEQFENLELARSVSTDRFINLMYEYTGILVKPYTGYQFFDAAGDYLGDTEYDSLSEILEKAEIEVADDGKM